MRALRATASINLVCSWSLFVLRFCPDWVAIQTWQTGLEQNGEIELASW